MLSFLYRIATSFENEHGHRANLIYLNPSHMQQLRQDLANIGGMDELIRFLGMELVIDTQVSHPHVAYSPAHAGIVNAS